jgi:hypothetical protein
MKCDKCGFIYKGNVERCPYCGNIIKETNDELLGKKIFFGRSISIKLSSLISVLLVNLFIIFFIMDLAILNSGFFVTTISYIIFISPIFVYSAIKTRVVKLLDAFIRIDIFLISALILSTLFLKIGYIIPDAIDIRPIIGLIVLPIYLIVSTILIVIFLFITNWKFKNVEFVFFAPLHFTVSIIIFIFNLVNKANNYDVFSFLNIYDNFEGLIGVADVLAAFASIFTVIFMIDFYIFIAYKIYHFARYKYGNQD